MQLRGTPAGPRTISTPLMSTETDLGVTVRQTVSSGSLDAADTPLWVEDADDEANAGIITAGTAINPLRMVPARVSRALLIFPP